MKALMNGIEIEGTPKEIAELVFGKQVFHPLQEAFKNDSKRKKVHKRPKSKSKPNLNKPYTSMEDALIKDKYPVMDTRKLAKLLGRSYGAVRMRAGKLNVYKPEVQE